MQNQTKLLTKTIKMKKTLLLLFVIFMIQINSFAQATNLEVNGVVIDESGLPITGANIIELGTSNGALSDFDGKFTINVKSNSILEFSYLGYKSIQVPISGQTELRVIMETENSQLDEIVIVGYGTSSRRNVTGSISQISSSEFERVPVTNALESIQGRVPGLQISPSSGQPGAGIDIIVRGTQSINGTNAPIFVVDGTITESINNLNPQDIKSFSVLKDASAVAIYGSRAANGVILVTTQRGNKGKALSITFNTQQSIQQESNQKIGFLNSTQWVDLLTEAYDNAGVTIPWTSSDLGNYDGVNVIWPDAIKRTGIISTYDLSVTGGGEKSNYFISGSYLKNEGIIKGEDFERMNFRINTDHKISDRITFGESINIFSSSRNLNIDFDGRNLYEASMRYTPLNSMYDDEGDFATIGNVLLEGRTPSPLWLLKNSSANTKQKGLIGNAYITINLLEGLDFTTRGSVEWTSGPALTYLNDDNVWTNSYSTSFIGAMDPKYNMEGANVNRVGKENQESLHWIGDFLLNYNNVFNDIHSVNALLGYSIEEDTWENLFGSRNGTPSNDIRYLDAGDPATAINGNGFSDWSIESLFARLGYSYKDKYILSGAIRRDGTSRFSEGNRYGVFPAVSFAWRMTEENFMNSDSDSNWLSELKLRASWGVVGNSLGISPYGTVRALNQSNAIFNQGPVVGYTITDAVNSDLSWESTTKKNIGFDAYLFDKKFYMIADFFIEDTNDLLFQQPIPQSTGLSGSPFINAGQVRNTGYEFQLGYRQNKGDWSYDFNFNLSHVKNEVIDLEGRDLRSSGIVEGHPIGTFFGYKSGGIIRTQADLDNNPQFQGKQIGDIMFLDVDGLDANGNLTGQPDGVVDAADRTLVGNVFPNLNLGLFGSVGYKNFTFQIQLQAVTGVDKNMRNGGYVTDMFTSEPNMEGDYILDRFHPVNNPNGQYPRVTIDDQGQNGQFSDFWLVDGSYLSIRNINVNYDIPNSVSKKFGVNDLSVFAGIQNLHTFGNPYAEISRIVDVPITKKFTLGLKATF